MSATRTYDPFAVERPVLKLGTHGAWTLGDITDSRHANIVKWYEAINELQDREGASMLDLARSVGELCAAACIGAEGVPELLVDLADEEKHGDDAIGGRTLQGIAEFVMGWLAGEESAGNV